MLLKDAKLQEELKNNGYVVIPFLTDTELSELNTFYDSIHNNQEPPDFIDNIHMTTWCRDATYKNLVKEKLMAVFANASNSYFEDYRRLNNVFIVKRSGKETVFKVHQDWNVVDENQFESVNVWVPLQDVDEHSGALWVLKGSHRINRKIRGAGYLFPDYSKHYAQIEKQILSIKLRAGEAIVFYHSVIHGSPANLSNHYRKAACFSVVPKAAPLCIYFQLDAQHPLEQHEPPDDFMFNYDYLRTDSEQLRPTEKPLFLFPPYINKKVEMKELATLLNANKSMMRLLRERFLS